MTDQFHALSLLVAADQAEDALQQFYDQWRHEKLVLDKWFAVQAGLTPPDKALAKVQELTGHPDFDWKNPNRFRAVIGRFSAQNLAGFHGNSAAGYDFFADWTIKQDGNNPQIAAGMCKTMESWRRFDETRQAGMKASLQKIQSAKNLSKNTSEIVGLLLS